MRLKMRVQRAATARNIGRLAMWMTVVGCASPRNPIAETLVGTDVPSPRIGMLYLVWHAPAATALRIIKAQGGEQLTVEDVIRGKNGAVLSDVLQKWGLVNAAEALYYHVRPKLGFYCIYRARPGQAGYMPDCPKIESTLRKHAAQLIGAGVDYIVTDATNLTDMDRRGDLFQLRPTEVLFEEWAKLRKKGLKTPQIAVWHAVPSGSTQWRGYQALYQNPAYDGLVMHDKKSGKKVFFVVDPPDQARFPDPSIIASIENNGGRNDVLVQRMWTIDRTDPSIDRWAFMSRCQDGGKETSNVVGVPLCAQPYTEKSTLGRAIAVAPSFQTSYASLPFGSPGRLAGLTYKRQWETAFLVRPDYVFISGWNEFIATARPNPFTDQWYRSAGLEADPIGASVAFTDTHGAEFGRDIEPTEEYGREYYDLTLSCVGVFKANAKSGATSCSSVREPCCDTKKSEVWTNVFALKHNNANDELLTTSRAERDALLAPGTGWREVCVSHGEPTLFCRLANEPESPAGPFVAFSVAGPGRKPLYRCLAGTHHFYSLDPSCGNQKTESILAFLPQSKTSESARPARRCLRSTGEHFIGIAPACPTGTTDEGLLGYVH